MSAPNELTIQSTVYPNCYRFTFRFSLGLPGCETVTDRKQARGRQSSSKSSTRSSVSLADIGQIMNHPSTSNELPANGAPTPMMAPYGAAPSMLASTVANVANQPNSGGGAGGAVSLSLPAAPPVGFTMPACAAAYAQPWPYSASIVTPVPVPVPVCGGPAPRLRKACDLCHENRLKCVMTPTGKCEQCTARGFECKRCATAQPSARPELVLDPALTPPVPCVLSQAAGWRRSAAGHG